MVSPLVAFRAQVRSRDGRLDLLDVDRWLAEADEVDLRVISRAIGPVLDIGCGPGRHVDALSRRSTEVVGIDLSPEFVALAQNCGRPVRLQSVFDPLPGGPRWGSVLLFDGSVGIGGSPDTLLRRVVELLVPGGRVLVETGAPADPSEALELFIESDDGGAWFSWASLSATDAESVAHLAGLTLTDQWEDSGRWFVQLDKAPSLTGERSGTPDVS
jgi:SAM-dependent methyltransferase